jgi:ubiquinone/menaquinone biosynthesis C-methylase UbiE
MANKMNNIGFKMMSLFFKIRDLIRPREEVLKEVKIKPGFHILDYGCGPGSYSICASKLVEEKGKVYAVDIHPLAIRSTEQRAKKAGLKNVEGIVTDCKTGLTKNSIDVAFLYDVFHDLSDPEGVLAELHRILKPGGILSFSDHHMKEGAIISSITKSGLFKLMESHKHTLSFAKIS